jgi:hypothetical protein
VTERKKDWNKPELIILVRNKPEEAVLENCKSTSTEGPWEILDHCEEQGWGGCSIIADS